MKSVRTVIKDRMRHLGLKPYDVVKLVRGKVTPPTVYNFVNGDTEMNTKSLGFVLDALDLHLIGGDDARMAVESRTPKRSKTGGKQAGRKR